MTEICITPLKYCREYANKRRVSADQLTQHGMADILNVPHRTYCGYESGENPTPVDVMMKAAVICECEHSEYFHLMQNPIAAKLLPNIEIMTVSQATLRLISAAARYIAVQTDMVNMASDGYIDDTEKEKWNKTILPILNDLKKATIELQFAVPDGEKK